MKYIIAGKEPEAYEYINRKLEERIRNGEKVSSIDDYKYVHSIDVLRGIRNPTGVFIGTWIERKDLAGIFQTLLYSTDIKEKQTLINTLWGKWKEHHDKDK